MSNQKIDFNLNHAITLNGVEYWPSKDVKNLLEIIRIRLVDTPYQFTFNFNSTEAAHTK
jgi:hypothetical protein